MPANRETPLVGVAALKVYSPRIEIHYDPSTDLGHVNFNFQRFLTVDGLPQAGMEVGRSGNFRVDIRDIVTRMDLPRGAADPITGLLIEDISGAGVMLAIKAIFDALFAEHTANSQPINVTP